MSFVFNGKKCVAGGGGSSSKDTSWDSLVLGSTRNIITTSLMV